MQYLKTSAGWVAPGETSGWISPKNVAESSGWVAPYEMGGMFNYDEDKPEPELKLDPSLTSPLGRSGLSGAGKKGENVSPVVAAITSVVDPLTGMIKWFSGGKEIGMLQAQAAIEEAKAKAELAKANVFLGLKTQKQGISTNTILLMAGGALALFLLLK
jgi:hypothetical protein